jgi:flagellar basal-body rod protein FlgC
MGIYGSLDVSVSGMIAQRVRMDTIAANLANINTTVDEFGEPNPYQRRFAEFMPGDPSATSPQARRLGVHVANIGTSDAAPRKDWDPTNRLARPAGTPDAGYVYYPSIDPVTEEINGLEAQRAYEANVTAAEATKSILAQALRMIA